MSANQPIPPPQTQPRTYKITAASVLSLPFRICNPPPAVGKVRSCGVTPLCSVRLEDVLDRKHLPPLGLKDFEEWLLYVEMSPENLYFTLWLREYRIRYNQWASQTKFQRDSGDYRKNWSSYNSSQLAMFYARAKQTFFTPASEYELNLASNLIAPFHTSNETPHPNPAIFTEVAIETNRMLDESLRRFVHAQLNNVGNKRVLCGIIAGIVFCLIGSVAPIAVNFTHSHSRWSRIAAFPGLWLGLTILIASLNGICLGVYIFGDLRQLRKFELTRPSISKPTPLPGPWLHPSPIHNPISQQATYHPAITPIAPIVQPPIVNDIPPSPATYPPHAPSRPETARPQTSSSNISQVSASSSASSFFEEDMIHISPAYYDADVIEGPATSAVVPIPINYTFPAANTNTPQSEGTRTGAGSASSSFITTATFIQPFDSAIFDEGDINLRNPSPKFFPEDRQPLSAFDFDALPTLPPRAPRYRPRPANINNPSSNSMLRQKNPPLNINSDITPLTPSPLTIPEKYHDVCTPRRDRFDSLSSSPSHSFMTRFLARFQSGCSIEQWRLQTGYLESARERYSNSEDRFGTCHPSSPSSARTLFNPSSPSPVSRISTTSTTAPSPSPSHSKSKSKSFFPFFKVNKRTSGVKTIHCDNDLEQTEERVQKRFRMIKAVPAFAVPLTKVLSPVIVRGQWEIVVRSAGAAFLVSWIVVGTLLAIPVIVT